MYYEHRADNAVNGVAVSRTKQEQIVLVVDVVTLFPVGHFDLLVKGRVAGSSKATSPEEL